jgi:microcystin-dependent protein
MSEPFLGQLALVGFNFAPKGWALCQGQLMAIAQNTALFSLLGTTYGGDGTTTFGLPDLRGRAALGFGQGPGLGNYSQGQTGGVENVTLAITQMPQHSHTVGCFVGDPSTGSPAGQVLANADIYSATANNVMNPSTIGVAGGSQPHNNMPPFLTLNWVIALEGIYPSRS